MMTLLAIVQFQIDGNNSLHMYIFLEGGGKKFIQSLHICICVYLILLIFRQTETEKKNPQISFK